MTQVQARMIRPKGLPALSRVRSGDAGALVIRVRHMRHEIFERLLLHGLPGPGARTDKAPTACRIGFVPVLDPTYVGLGAIGRIPAEDPHLRPTWWDTLLDHVAKQGLFPAIPGVALGQNEPKAHGDALAVPGRHQQDAAQAKKPGMMRADAPFLRH